MISTILLLDKSSSLMISNLTGLLDKIRRSIERVADHAAGIANKCLKIAEKIPEEVFQKIDNMSRFSLRLLNDSVEAFLRRDYYLADKIGDKVEAVHG